MNYIPNHLIIESRKKPNLEIEFDKNRSNTETSSTLKRHINSKSISETNNNMAKISLIKKNHKLFQLFNHSSRECALCQRTSRMKILRQKFQEKYFDCSNIFNVKLINDIIYNESTHIVSIFKDYLIYDDLTEFLKRFYMKSELPQRLKKIFDFYSKYSKVFPNYINLYEKRFMFKNIERKQKMIDEKQQDLADIRNKNSPGDSSIEENKIFTTNFMEELNKTYSILQNKLGDLHDANNSSKMKSYLLAGTKINKLNQQSKEDKSTRIELLNLQELVEKFVAKDSQSNIETSIMISQTKKEVTKTSKIVPIVKSNDFKLEFQNSTHLRTKSNNINCKNELKQNSSKILNKETQKKNENIDRDFDRKNANPSKKSLPSNINYIQKHIQNNPNNDLMEEKYHKSGTEYSNTAFPFHKNFEINKRKNTEEDIAMQIIRSIKASKAQKANEKDTISYNPDNRPKSNSKLFGIEKKNQVQVKTNPLNERVQSTLKGKKVDHFINPNNKESKPQIKISTESNLKVDKVSSKASRNKNTIQNDKKMNYYTIKETKINEVKSGCKNKDIQQKMSEEEDKNKKYFPEQEKINNQLILNTAADENKYQISKQKSASTIKQLILESTKNICAKTKRTTTRTPKTIGIEQSNTEINLNSRNLLNVRSETKIAEIKVMKQEEIKIDNKSSGKMNHDFHEKSGLKNSPNKNNRLINSKSMKTMRKMLAENGITNKPHIDFQGTTYKSGSVLKKR